MLDSGGQNIIMFTRMERAVWSLMFFTARSWPMNSRVRRLTSLHVLEQVQNLSLDRDVEGGDWFVTHDATMATVLADQS